MNANGAWRVEVFPDTTVLSETRQGDKGNYTAVRQTEVYLHTGKKVPQELTYRLLSAGDALPVGIHEVDMSTIASTDEFGRLVITPTSRWKFTVVDGRAKAAKVA